MKNRTIKTSGFTLIELTITVAIIAILAAVAIPSYNQYVQKARRTDARESLLRVASAMEKYLLANNQYPDTITTLNDSIKSHGLEASGENWITQSGNYRLAIEVDAGGANRRVRAVAQGQQQSDDDCRTFQFFLDGRRSAFHKDGPTTTDTCWPD